MPSDDKAVLRASVRARRRAWSESASPADRQARATALASAVLADPDVRRACDDRRVVTCFASMPTEPPTSVLLAALSAAGARVLLPLVRPERSLHWAWFSEGGALQPAGMGIPEPTGEVVAHDAEELLALDPAVLLIPALAVDQRGARLGQGGGYFDTLMGRLPPSTDGGPLIVALVGIDECLAPGAIPTEPHDREVDRCVCA